MAVMDVQADLIESVSAATEAMLASGEARDAYALALSMAEDGMGIGFCWTSESHFRQHLLEMGGEEDLAPEDEIYFRWAVAEWLHEGWRDELFASVNDAVSTKAMSRGLSKTEFDALVEAMVAALASLRDRWPEALKGVTMFVTVSDSEDAEALEDGTAEKLNPPELRDAFLARFDGLSEE